VVGQVTVTSLPLLRYVTAPSLVASNGVVTFENRVIRYCNELSHIKLSSGFQVTHYIPRQKGDFFLRQEKHSIGFFFVFGFSFVYFHGAI
jgi:hypothetical protein